jgi:alcohol dehydrogenase class IV
MEFNLNEAPERFAELARALGVRETRGLDLKEAGRKAIERVRQLQVLLKEHSGLASRLSEVGVDEARLPEIVAAAEAIRAAEREQARRMRTGTSFRQQVRFDDYLAHRASNPAFAFREHLRAVGKAIEE